jgi:Rho GDP-dissociation inhibitor
MWEVTMSSAVEAMSCSGKDIPAGKEEAARNAELGGDGAVANSDAPPHCRMDADEDEVPKVIDLGPRVSIKDQLEKDRVRSFLQPHVDLVCSVTASRFPVRFFISRLRLQDDESLRRWKEQLLGSVDLNSVGGKPPFNSHSPARN